MRPDALFLAGLAAYLPPVLSAETAAARGWYDPDNLHHDGWTGAAVAGDTPPAEMAVHAARTALARSGVPATDLDLLLYADTFPQGPHCWCPQHHVERLVVGRGIPAIELRQGCAGMLDALDLAAAYLAVPGRRAALLTGADNFGVDPATGPDPALRWRYADNGNTHRGSVLGDAATAAVLSNRGGFARVLSIATRSLSELEELYRGGEPMFPPAHGPDRPFRLGRRFADYDRQHPGALSQALTRLGDARTDLARQVLAEAELPADRVTRVLHVFAGTERYLKHLLDPLGIDPARGLLEFGRGLGHLGVGDQLAGLEHLLLTGQVGPGDHVLMMANGTGASLGCAVLAIDERPEWAW
ncbi:hypothetical protein Cs7R123_01690 [Catellatospora sp. TT07R-123]|uniref:ketoacyl-ACP synthase III family protein n=1 Tax=Catellatospora sp. TT07R-123 TaxID=2733863 RepID=UPI001B19548C|nr:ketoacyl-ACP synthase III family protein [Catellatospora sp. TT07R-123]GHJ42827.1 hypothetical protein Cs7R123_01690 [Catellatospora sp. TT07R-123]